MTEAEAAEALQSEGEFSGDEIERMVSLVTDPSQSMWILGFDDQNSRRLNRAQMEKLLQQALTDSDTVEVFYTTLTESGVELNENETWWLEYIQRIKS